MAERRQAHRREPIIVVVREEELEARPLPWLKRNDLGNAVIRQYTEMMNSTMRSFINADGAPELEMYLNDKLKNPLEILSLGYPDLKVKPEWEYPELYELIFASLDVNDLEHLKELVDPNSLTPKSNGGRSSSGTRRAQSIQKLLSSPNSDSVESPEKKSETSPTEKSSTSSENKTASSGKTAGGRSRRKRRSQSNVSTN